MKPKFLKIQKPHFSTYWKFHILSSSYHLSTNIGITIIFGSRIGLSCHPTDLLHVAEAPVFDVYSEEVYTVVEWQQLSQSGPELWGDDSADG